MSWNKTFLVASCRLLMYLGCEVLITCQLFVVLCLHLLCNYLSENYSLCIMACLSLTYELFYCTSEGKNFLSQQHQNNLFIYFYYFFLIFSGWNVRHQNTGSRWWEFRENEREWRAMFSSGKWRNLNCLHSVITMYTYYSVSNT